MFFSSNVTHAVIVLETVYISTVFMQPWPRHSYRWGLKQLLFLCDPGCDSGRAGLYSYMIQAVTVAETVNTVSVQM